MLVVAVVLDEVEFSSLSHFQRLEYYGLLHDLKTLLLVEVVIPEDNSVPTEV